MESPECARRLIAALYQRGQYREAITQARLALQDNPDDGRVWELSGMAAHALQQNEDARAALETATTLVPLSPGGQCVLARVYALGGHRELAREIYRHLLSLEHLPPRLLSTVAAGLGSVGELELALQACRRAATGQLHSGQPLYGMAYYMERLGYPLNLVASVLRKAVHLEPDRFRYRLALAMAYQRLGRLEEACNLLRPMVSDHRLRNIRCADCLRKMAALFTACGESHLSRACHEHLSQLPIPPTPPIDL